MGKSFSITRQIKSFHYALQGLRYLWNEEHNFRIHLAAAIVVVTGGCILTLTTAEWCIVLLCIALVMITETINTSIENISNYVSPGFHPAIKKIKDLSAAAVLLSSVAALIIGLIIFIPKITALW
ncbi:MAG: diacylglycerol kinase family protein [Flavobacteriales bacterium]